MISSQIKINKFSRRRVRDTLLGLSLATSIFWVSSQLPNSKAIACVPGSDNTGFVCKTVERVTEQAPFNEGSNADWLQGLFLVLNLVIAGRLLWKGYQTWFEIIDINTKRGKF